MDSKDEADAVDHEPMADLLTVFVGFGIFSANCALRFHGHPYGRGVGIRIGCLPEEVYGYSLAKFAIERGETNPIWVSKLSDNVKAFYTSSRAFLDQTTSGLVS
jgi:hypothetical protein